MKSSSLRSIVGSIVLVLVAGCSEEAPPPAAGPPYTGPVDTQVVRSVGPGKWISPVRLIEEVRIGVTEGDPSYIMANVQQMAVGPDGTIYVYDKGPKLRAYDAQGRFLRQIGGRGDGPGEYRGVAGMAVNPEGELVVYDVPLRRITFFRPDGEYSRMVKTHSDYWRDDTFRVDRAGNMLVFGVRPTATEPVGYTPDGRPMYDSERPGGSVSFYLRLDPKGQPLDTVPAPVSYYVPGPFEDQLVFGTTRDGWLVFGHRKEYAINVQLARDSLLRIEREFEAVPLGNAEREQWLARQDYINRESPNSIGAGAPIAKVKPAFKAIAADDDGRIWVHRFAEAVDRPSTSEPQPNQPPPITWRDVPTFDVFDSDGSFLGTVLMPFDSEIFVRRGSHLWAVVRGSLGEEYVVRYRLEVG